MIEDEDEDHMTVRENFRWASIFGCVLAAEIAAYFPLRDAFPGYVEGTMCAVASNIVITMTAGIIVMCLIDAAYLLGYMTYRDFRCFFPRHEDKEVSLMVYIAGLSLTRRCFQRAWSRGRCWPTVVDATFVVLRKSPRRNLNK